MMEQLHYEWSQSFHIEFEFNWTKTTPKWESIFQVTGNGFEFIVSLDRVTNFPPF